MVTMEVFLIGILITSTLTGLATEAVKKLLAEYNRTYHANALAGIIALVMSAAVGTGYLLVTETGFTMKTVIYLAALIFMSWLCAMVGYDKVMQAIGQFKPFGKPGGE